MARPAGDGSAAGGSAGDGAAGDPAGDLACELQFLALRTEQGRLAELEVAARALVARHPGSVPAQAALVHVLAVLGRDREATAGLGRLAADQLAPVGDPADNLAPLVRLADAAVRLDRWQEATVLYELLSGHATEVAEEVSGAVCLGAVARAVGGLAHLLGAWEKASDHFALALAVHRDLGAPLLVADTQRAWSALLRVRGDDGDWQHAVDLLAEAATVYRRLGLDHRVSEVEAVLARAEEPPAGVTGTGGSVFRSDGDEWLVAYGGHQARVAGATGLEPLAVLLANPGRSFHVFELAAVAPAGVGRADQGRRPVRALAAAVTVADRIDARVASECRQRLAVIEADERIAEGRHDHVAVAVARAEADVVAAALAGGGHDPVERARRLTGIRIRLAVDAIEAAHPALARHLRRSVRTGTFCCYEPPLPTSWSC